MIKNRPSLQASRRQFLGAAAAAAAITIVPRHVLGGPRFVAPSEKVNIAVVGVGGQGRTNIQALFNEEEAQVIAVCDVAEKTDLNRFYYGGNAGRGPVKDMVEKHYREKTPAYKCAAYEDFHELFDKEKAIDAVLCATPDHLHALVTVTAMKLGKHIYCEKPMCHNIWELRQVAKLAKETGVATQMGNQGHSGEGLRAAAEWIWDGAIGAIREVYGWTNAGHFVNGRGRPKGAPVPAGLNWDKWLGPRDARPYDPSYCPFTWRGYWSFGTAALGDMACHNLDPAVFALKLVYPTSVEATSDEFVDPEVCSSKMRVTWEFPARGEQPAVKMHWLDGGLRPPTPAGVDPKDPRQRLGDGGNGIIFIGEKGVITAGGWAGMPRILPPERNREYKKPEKTLPRTKGHHADWLKSCKGGGPSSANFEYSARLTEIVLLGDVAVRTGKKLEWDGPNMRATNAPEADRLIKETYRAGWELPL